MNDGCIHVGAVICLDGVRFAAAESSADQLRSALARYVEERAALALWPNDTAAVIGLLSGGELGSAIDRYFASVGTRWDQEWLVTAKLTVAKQVGR